MQIRGGVFMVVGWGKWVGGWVGEKGRRGEGEKGRRGEGEKVGGLLLLRPHTLIPLSGDFALRKGLQKPGGMCHPVEVKMDGRGVRIQIGDDAVGQALRV